MSKLKTTPILKTLNASLIDLPAPSNITHFWNFGSMLGTCLTIQILSGVFLAMHYSSDISLAFSCIDHIMRDVNYGWFIRLIHANGASLFFFVMFLHIGRGLYFHSFMLTMTWIMGMVIFLLSMLTGFLGYVLPWGQMSYWGATVITNLLSAVPYMGMLLVEWVWGGFSVNNSTLTRFFSFHFLFPFMLVLTVIFHLVFLHEQKSSNPMGIQMASDKIPFYPYFSSKDILSISIFIFVFILISLLYPYILMDPENFIPANPLSTPIHIQPEWYFLFAYAILRSIPNKLGGVLALLLSILILAPLSFKKMNTKQKSSLMFKMSFWFLSSNFILLTWLGMKPVEDPYLMTSQLMTMFYFLWFITAFLL